MPSIHQAFRSTSLPPDDTHASSRKSSLDPSKPLSKTHKSSPITSGTESPTNSSTSSFSNLSLGGDSSASTASSYTVTDHACSMLHGKDALRLYGFDEKTEREVRNLMLSGGREVSHEHRLGDGGVEFKFKQRMWQNACRFTGRRCPGTQAQAFLCHYLQCLEANGWSPIVVSDVGHSDVESDAIYFRRSVKWDTKYFACQFDEGDKLRVTEAPSDVLIGFRHIFSKHKFHEDHGDNSSLFKMHGYPFISDHEQGHKTRLLLLTILDMFTAAGWELMISLNASGEGGKTSNHARTWLVRQSPQSV